MNLALAAQHIHPRRILDIGANIGQWYSEAREQWPDAEFLLIEGNPACARHLAGLPHHIALLSDRVRTVLFHTRKDNPTSTGSSIYREKTRYYAKGDVAIYRRETTTLDRLVPGGFDLIKIDTQGSELDILRGATRHTSHAQALILELSYEEYNSGAPLAGEVIAYCDSLGFTRRIELGDIMHPYEDRLIQKDVLFLRGENL